MTSLLILLAGWCCAGAWDASAEFVQARMPVESRRVELPVNQPPQAACIELRTQPVPQRWLRSCLLTTLSADLVSVTRQQPSRVRSGATVRRSSRTLQEIRIRLQI